MARKNQGPRGIGQWDLEKKDLAAIERVRGQIVDANNRLRMHVGDARAHGASWAAIGDALGVSAQAAYQRFSDDGREKHADRQRERFAAVKPRPGRG